MSFSLDIKVLGIEELNVKNSGELVIEMIDGGLYGWNTIKQLSGIWCSISLSQNGILAAMGIIDTDFNNQLNVDGSKWIDDVDVLSNITSLYINKEYNDDLISLLEQLLNLSDNKTLLLLPHYQGAKEEIIQGPIRFERFIELLNCGNIPFNVCTIIIK